MERLDDYQIGRTKVFLKYWHVDILNRFNDPIYHAIIKIQVRRRACSVCCNTVGILNTLFNFQAGVGFLFRKFLHENGFTEIHSPKLIGAAR